MKVSFFLCVKRSNNMFDGNEETYRSKCFNCAEYLMKTDV